eukprot:SAG11_NODE_26498_length_344_cov_1.008163_1_plen_69_part_10
MQRVRFLSLIDFDVLWSFSPTLLLSEWGGGALSTSFRLAFADTSVCNTEYHRGYHSNPSSLILYPAPLS